MPRKTAIWFPLTIAFCAWIFASSSCALEPSTSKEWSDQESWLQFTDKNHRKPDITTSESPAVTRTPTVLEMVLTGNQPNASVNGGAPYYSNKPVRSTAAEGSFALPGYVCMPPSTAPSPANSGHPSFEIAPSLYPAGRPYFAPVPGFPTSQWQGGMGRWPGSMPLSNRFGIPFPGMPLKLRVTRTAPTRSAGNFYMPATPDSSASGNYYAPPMAPPVAMPIINAQPDSSDYWGKTGNPLPADQRPN